MHVYGREGYVVDVVHQDVYATVQDRLHQKLPLIYWYQLTLLQRQASADLSMHLHLITNELVLLTRSTVSSPLYITLGSNGLKLLLPRFVLVTAVDLKIKRSYSAPNSLLEATHRGVIMTSDLTGLNERCR